MICHAARSCKAIVAALVVLSSLATGSASADTLRYDGPWFGSYYGTYNIRDGAPSSVNLNVYAGAFRMTDTSGPSAPAGTSFMAWCVDIRHALGSSASYSLQQPGSLFLGGLVASRLERLASYVVANDGNPATNTLQTALTGSQQSAAFQLAVWEIVNEGTAASYNVDSGDFYVASGNTAVRAQANTWLSNAMAWTGASTQSISVWEGPNSTQDLAVFAPIPEPETYAMLLAGLGLMGFVARRRRQI